MNEWMFEIYIAYLFLGLTSWFILKTHKYADCEQTGVQLGAGGLEETGAVFPQVHLKNSS